MSQATAEGVSEPPASSQSLTVATSESARQRQKIAALEEKLQSLEAGHEVKQRYECHLHLVLLIHYHFQRDELLHVERKGHSACCYTIR
jgi:hypothetical protein